MCASAASSAQDGAGIFASVMSCGLARIPGGGGTGSGKARCIFCVSSNPHASEPESNRDSILRLLRQGKYEQGVTSSYGNILMARDRISHRPRGYRPAYRGLP
jgi:hypothetical protein